jgi:hypothetical protein
MARDGWWSQVFEVALLLRLEHSGLPVPLRSAKCEVELVLWEQFI